MTPENNGIFIVNSSVIVGNSGDTSISFANAGEQLGEMETEIVRIFRTLTLRERVAFMTHAYAYEDDKKQKKPPSLNDEGIEKERGKY